MWWYTCSLPPLQPKDVAAQPKGWSFFQPYLNKKCYDSMLSSSSVTLKIQYPSGHLPSSYRLHCFWERGFCWAPSARQITSYWCSHYSSHNFPLLSFHPQPHSHYQTIFEFWLVLIKTLFPGEQCLPLGAKVKNNPLPPSFHTTWVWRPLMSDFMNVHLISGEFTLIHHNPAQLQATIL